MPTAHQVGVNSSLRHYFKVVAATRSVDPETRDRSDAQDAGRRFFRARRLRSARRPHGA